MIVWLSFRHNANICIEKRKRPEMRALHSLLLNGSISLRDKITINDIIDGFKNTTARIRGDIVDKNIIDYRYYLIEPSIDVNLIHENTLFVFVQSKDSNREKRKQIRETWANRKVYSDYHDNPICVIFAVGLPPNVFISNKTDPILRDVIEEADKTKDILLLNMMDIYDNLTIKGFLTMLWIASQRFRSNYILKTDDDVLLNTFAWFRIVKKIQTNDIQCVLVGCAWRDPPVYRYGKYVVSPSEYRYAKFPSFMSGSGYLMTRVTMITILEAAFQLPFLTRDDPYFAGIIPRLTGIPLVSLPQSAYLLNDAKVNSDKLLKRGILVVHNPDNNVWSSAWAMFQRRQKYGYPKTYQAVIMMSRHRVSKFAHPVMLSSATDYKTMVPLDWRLQNDACLMLNCNKPFPKVRWQIPA
ncbi:hypothetical protein LSH36_282g03040 [Paralvinella palmiformis]|uniref:Hexosyltransferase n=1 Tax=Paralvinella palmiformis TaxID=53620 RepID=A0AAD9JIL3_9ANNE|nr:hypothetical protein LSH36_282g03040 [Paralvinella palmiformis]